MLLANLGVAALRQDQLAQAHQHVCQALRTATELRMVYVYALPLPATALLLAELGHTEQAVEVYALASRHPLVSASRWFDEVVGRRTATVTAGLPPEVVAAAQARGRARDLQTTVAELATALAQRLPHS